jgi:protein tweety
LYGNDDLHNGLVQVFNAGKQLNRLFISVRNQVISIFAVPTILNNRPNSAIISAPL